MLRVYVVFAAFSCGETFSLQLLFDQWFARRVFPCNDYAKEAWALHWRFSSFFWEGSLLYNKTTFDAVILALAFLVFCSASLSLFLFLAVLPEVVRPKRSVSAVNDAWLGSQRGWMLDIVVNVVFSRCVFRCVCVCVCMFFFCVAGGLMSGWLEGELTGCFFLLLAWTALGTMRWAPRDWRWWGLAVVRW